MVNNRSEMELKNEQLQEALNANKKYVAKLQDTLADIEKNKNLVSVDYFYCGTCGERIFKSKSVFNNEQQCTLCQTIRKF